MGGVAVAGVQTCALPIFSRDASPSPSASCRPRARALLLLCVVGGAVEVDQDHGLVADDIGVVPGRQAGHLARADLELLAGVGDDADAAGGVILEVRRLAPLPAGPRLQ